MYVSTSPLIYLVLWAVKIQFFSMKAAELKCQNLIVKKVCQMEHFKTFRKVIGPELGLQRPKICAKDRGERETVSIRRIVV